MHKWIYHFSAGKAEGNASMEKLLGGKGANLAEMCNLNLPIPPGFTISTEVCNYYYHNNHILPLQLTTELEKAIKHLETETGKTFGRGSNPLLISVRSGAVASMPGMMDTVLNLGLNDEVLETMAVTWGSKGFALDSYRRFLQMYGSTVLNIPRYVFEDVFESLKNQCGIFDEEEMNAEVLTNVVDNYKKIITKYSNQEFPSDPYEQLKAAIAAVLKSWMSPRALVYRRLHNIPETLGTAVNIQSMVFGNINNDSATGVVFTRSPATGEKEIFGEFLINAQGEDVVAGIRTPLPIIAKKSNDKTMQKIMPEIFAELQSICHNLEQHYKNVQDIEFTVENNKLYILQTRNAKRSAAAHIKTAVDMVEEGLIPKTEALLRIEPDSLNQLLHSGIDYRRDLQIIAQGLAASPGAATGIVVFSPYDAEELSHHHKVILVRHDTSPEDIKGMHVSAGVLTARGGMTSHAAVVARGMGRPCVCGVSGIVVDEKNKILKIGDLLIKHGDEITIDGTTGKVFLGRAPLIQPTFSAEFEKMLTWADEEKTLIVRANAETAIDTVAALKFGAEGIGLCRTEHMFFDKEKIPLVREMIVAPDLERRKNAIAKLLPLQIADFKELFRIINGHPINIRLLDPPLHEFLPVNENDKKLLAESLNLPLSLVEERLHAMHEVNPMLGHRGCRLGITYPEIYQMQLEAIFIAIKDLYLQENITTVLELMIPLVSNVNELTTLKTYIWQTAEKIENTYSIKLHFKIGTMIELPRAALQAGAIASEVSYFSFGTNDLTQTTYGISRDDINSFLPEYLEQKIFSHDPFHKLDEEGVGELIATAIERGKKSNPALILGVCGEHAGNADSIEFFHNIGINYISCSPYRIPIARVAAAQARIKSGQIK